MGKETDPGDGYETVMLLTKEFLDQSLNKTLSVSANFFEQQKKENNWIADCIATTSIKALGTS